MFENQTGQPITVTHFHPSSIFESQAGAYHDGAGAMGIGRVHLGRVHLGRVHLGRGLLGHMSLRSRHTNLYIVGRPILVGRGY
jgi:hypothetical protein